MQQPRLLTRSPSTRRLRSNDTRGDGFSPSRLIGRRGSSIGNGVGQALGEAAHEGANGRLGHPMQN